jgi:hypothetical protein
MFKEFWATISAGLKSKMGIRLGAFFSCCLATFAPVFQLQIVALFFAGIFTGLLVVTDGTTFTKPLQIWWKLRGKVNWVTPPEFLIDTAHKMKVKLNKKRPYGVVNMSIGAMTNVYNGQIIIGQDVLHLPEGQRNAVLAHELAHLRPIQAQRLLMLFYIVIFGSLIFSNAPPVITMIASISLFLIVRTIINHNLEYDADVVGSEYSLVEDMISALRNLVKPDEHDRASDTHPSVNNRVIRLLSINEPRWVLITIWIFGVFGSKMFNEEFMYSFVADLVDHCNSKSKIQRPFIVTKELLLVLIYFWLK